MVEKDRPGIIQKSDADLVKIARSEPEAFGQLYERYFDRVYRFAYHKLGNPQDAEDLAASTFEKAFKSLCLPPKDPSAEFQMRTDTSFKSWLGTIAHNNIANYLKTKSRHPLQSWDLSSDTDLFNSADPDPLEEAVKSETRQTVRTAIKQLNIKDRRVLVLKDFQELPFDEIGQALSIPENTARVQHHRAKGRLKGVLLKVLS